MNDVSICTLRYEKKNENWKGNASSREAKKGRNHTIKHISNAMNHTR